MEMITIVGSARDSRTRIKRTRAGIRRRKVRIGGIYIIRPSRSIQFTLAQCMQYEEELRIYHKDGLVLFYDERGREVPPFLVFGGEKVAAPESEPTEPSPAESESEKVEEVEEVEEPESLDPGKPISDPPAYQDPDGVAGTPSDATPVPETEEDDPEPEVIIEDDPELEATVEDDLEPLPEGYDTFIKKDLLALFEGRLEVPEDTRNDNLVSELSVWENEHFE